MPADGRLPAQVQGYAPYRTGVARTEACPGPHPEAEGRRRRFAMLVVVPVLLMLGSVYLNTLAAGLDARTAELGVRLDRAREVGERLEVKVAELSGAERIRALAAEKLGMHEPKSTTLKVYGARAEDGKNDGAPQEGGRPRQR